MDTALMTIAAIIAAAILLVLAPVAFDTYQRYRNRKVVICPGNHKFAEVNLHAGRAGVTAMIGQPKLAVKWCSHWPNQQGCAEDCVKENWPAP